MMRPLKILQDKEVEKFPKSDGVTSAEESLKEEVAVISNTTINGNAEVDPSSAEEQENVSATASESSTCQPAPKQPQIHSKPAEVGQNDQDGASSNDAVNSAIQTAVSNIPGPEKDPEKLLSRDPYRAYLQEYFEELANKPWSRQSNVIAGTVESILPSDDDQV